MSRYFSSHTVETESRYGGNKTEEVTTIKYSKILMDMVGFIVGITLLFGSIYTVDEGHVGIVKRFSEAKQQVNPGLHFKVPFIDSVEATEIRTRKNEEKMMSSTKEQMPVTVIVSVNWTVEKSSAMGLFKEYGGLSQFENRILDPRFRAATKNQIPKYTAEELIRDRSLSVANIEAQLTEDMAGFPVVIESVQVEDISLPKKYLSSIETKQTEKNLADAESHKLERQRLESLRAVNTSDAQAQGILKVAEAEAQSIILKGEAEARAIEAKAKSLKSNPLIVELTKAQAWNGSYATTIVGSDVKPIMDMRAK